MTESKKIKELDNALAITKASRDNWKKRARKLAKMQDVDIRDLDHMEKNPSSIQMTEELFLSVAAAAKAIELSICVLSSDFFMFLDGERKSISLLDAERNLFEILSKNAKNIECKELFQNVTVDDEELKNLKSLQAFAYNVKLLVDCHSGKEMSFSEAYEYLEKMIPIYRNIDKNKEEKEIDNTSTASGT